MCTVQGVNMTLYDMEESFQCLQCAEGCDECEDSAPCIVTLNVVLRCAVIGQSVFIVQKVASELHPKVCKHGEGPY